MPEYDPLSDLYDLEYTHDYDLPFWLSLAEREARPVVEWGAGTGRISSPARRSGPRRYCRRDLRPRWSNGARKRARASGGSMGDMRSVDPGRRYGLAVCAFNSFLCLRSVDDALAFLRNANEHLVPGGLLGIEVSAFSPEELVDPPGGPALRHDFTRMLPDGRLERFSVSHYDAASQLCRCACSTNDTVPPARWRAGGPTTSPSASSDAVSWSLMLRLTGFEVEAVYGGFEGEPFTSTSDHLIVLARKWVS